MPTVTEVDYSPALSHLSGLALAGLHGAAGGRGGGGGRLHRVARGYVDLSDVPVSFLAQITIGRAVAGLQPAGFAGRQPLFRRDVPRADVPVRFRQIRQSRNPGLSDAAPRRIQLMKAAFIRMRLFS
jgi:hypothetical protein